MYDVNFTRAAAEKDIENEYANLQKAAEKDKSIQGFKDADQRYAELENRIKELYAQIEKKKKKLESKIQSLLDKWMVALKLQILIMEMTQLIITKI